MIHFRGGINLKDYGSFSSLFGAKESWESFVNSLNPTLWARFNEVSGNVINYGSDNNSGTPTNLTQNQVGQLGAGEAALYDGATSLVTFANADLPATKALTTQAWAFLVYQDSLGEANVTRFSIWSNVTTPSGGLRLASLSSGQFSGTLQAGTDAQATSNNNAVILDEWSIYFMDYDDSGTRKIRLWKTSASVAVTAITLSTDIAATGVVTTPTANLSLGALDTSTQTLDGLFDEIFAFSGLWTTDLMNQARYFAFGA